MVIGRYTRSAMARIWSAEHKLSLWLEVELLTCEALADLDIIPAEAAADLRRRAPTDIDMERIAAIEAEIQHDVVAFTTWLSEVIGPNARFIHYGLTSTDVVDTALSAILRDALDLILDGLSECRSLLAAGARRYKDTIMIGRTHGVHAEPTTFGLKLALWYAEIERNIERVRRARVTAAVGKVSGAVGTFAHLEPRVEAFVCRGMGLEPAPVSTQVLQRDRHAEVLTTLAVLAGTLEKMAVEIRHLQKTETREVEEPFRAGQKGSSAMPHKRNPEKCERVAGLARVIRGHALAALENQALWHERDISHSSVERIILPDSTTLIDYMLHLMNGVLKDMHVYPEAMQRNLDATGGLVFSQRVLLALVGSGMSREDAYGIVQELAMSGWEGGGPSFRSLVADDLRITDRLSAADIEACFDPKVQLKHIDTIFARVGLERGDGR